VDGAVIVEILVALEALGTPTQTRDLVDHGILTQETLEAREPAACQDLTQEAPAVAAVVCPGTVAPPAEAPIPDFPPSQALAKGTPGSTGCRPPVPMRALQPHLASTADAEILSRMSAFSRTHRVATTSIIATT